MRRSPFRLSWMEETTASSNSALNWAATAVSKTATAAGGSGDEIVPNPQQQGKTQRKKGECLKSDRNELVIQFLCRHNLWENHPSKTFGATLTSFLRDFDPAGRVFGTFFDGLKFVLQSHLGRKLTT